MNGNGGGFPHVNYRLILATREGEFAVMIQITDLGAEASPILAEKTRDNILSDLDHLVVDSQTTERKD